jgi:peptidoglycan/LPS O-acetylase OafA/YrhL
MSEPDDRIRRALEESHDADGAGARSFTAMWAAAVHARDRAHRRRPWLLATTSLVASAAIVLVLWLATRRPGEEPALARPPAAPTLAVPAVVAALDRWRPPTSFLLELPGEDFFAKVPRFGASPELGGAPATRGAEP